MTNVYQMVTDRIIEQMEKGIIPWHKPWVGGTGVAISYTSRKAYSALNQLLLGKPGEWLTWKQIQDHKGTVKKGAKSRFCVFFQWVEKKVENPDTHEIEDCSYPILKWYHVFHIEDTEGIESKIVKVVANPDIKPVQEAENIIKGYLDREPKLKFYCEGESGSAYYNPGTDEVVVPNIHQYAEVEEYYSTTFHELTHSTMHKDRCDRTAENKKAAFGGADYSREELVAEIGAAMLCNRSGLDSEKAFKNSVGYIQSWLKALRNNNHMIVWAAGRAEKAAKYILNEA